MLVPKKEKLITNVFSFYHNVFNFSKTSPIIFIAQILLSANVSSLDKSKSSLYIEENIFFFFLKLIRKSTQGLCGIYFSRSSQKKKKKNISFN